MQRFLEPLFGQQPGAKDERPERHIAHVAHRNPRGGLHGRRGGRRSLRCSRDHYDRLERLKERYRLAFDRPLRFAELHGRHGHLVVDLAAA